MQLLHSRWLLAATAAVAFGAAPQGATVSIRNFAFEPQTVTVRAGSSVTWTNLDDEIHTVRGADGLIRSDALDQNQTYTRKFDRPGTYRYGCSLHSQMGGTVVVN